MMVSEYEWQAVELSLQVSVLAVICGLPFGIFMAWLLVRCQFPGKALLEKVLHLPLVLPPVGCGGLHAVDRHGEALASAVVVFPLMVRAIRLALEAVDISLEQAARTLGATHSGGYFSPSRCRCLCPV